MEERNPVRPRADWMDKPFDEWPDAAKRFWDLMLTATARKMRADQSHHGDKVSE